MVAVAFDLGTARMQAPCSGGGGRNGSSGIRRILSGHGFDRTRGGVHFGDGSGDAATCVSAVQDVSRRLGWFGPAVRDVRMLRVEASNDPGPALGRTAA